MRRFALVGSSSHAHSVSEWVKEEAIRYLSANEQDLSGLHTHTMHLDELTRGPVTPSLILRLPQGFRRSASWWP